MRDVFRDRIGAGNYNVGHVLGAGGGGGVAYLESICNDSTSGGHGPVKGGGVTIALTYSPVGNSETVGMLTHELGHQFGADHSFSNNTAMNCRDNRNNATSWESGAGLTIMSYGGYRCPGHDIAYSRELRFHAGSFAQISAYLTDNAKGNGCAVKSSTGNNVPTVNGGADYTIPRETPFTLAATGNDADAGDRPKLTYCWEQVDSAGDNFATPAYTDAGDPPYTTRPIFRPRTPSDLPNRTFPDLSYILYYANVPPETLFNGLQTAEFLPRVSRTLNFRVTVRDGRGGVNYDGVTLTVAGGAGPFEVTGLDAGTKWIGGENRGVYWRVNGTNLNPVNCANVKISLPNVVGQYEFRYFTNNSFTLVMKSNVVTVSIGL